MSKLINVNCIADPAAVAVAEATDRVMPAYNDRIYAAHTAYDAAQTAYDASHDVYDAADTVYDTTVRAARAANPNLLISWIDPLFDPVREAAQAAYHVVLAACAALNAAADEIAAAEAANQAAEDVA
jgi:hypothetical protein